ncbi:glycosyltransferase family 2 protein [Altererythrobacter fulvus]|uniref:glycosyltransferase family 2 protein n=1 Tax=Caenibius fulvus TaxID=2126012 RepID=UPI00301867C6
MNEPFFSVVLPAYNAAGTVGEAIKSVLEQYCEDFELLLIDDGSSDDTLHRMLYYADRDDRIRVVSRDNGGVSSARNLGVELARGRFIAFLDADDQWCADKLLCHRLLHERRGDLAGSFARIAFRPPAGRGMGPARTYSTVPSGLLALEQVLGENPSCTTSNLVVSRAALCSAGGFDETLSHAEDQDLLARLIERGFHLQGIGETLVDYRMSEGGLSSDLGAMLAGWAMLADRYRHIADLSGAEALYCRYLARRALRTGGPAGIALGFVLRGLRADAHAFLEDFRRGALTLAGAAFSPFIPRTLRQRLFA